MLSVLKKLTVSAAVITITLLPLRLSSATNSENWIELLSLSTESLPVFPKWIYNNDARIDTRGGGGASADEDGQWPKGPGLRVAMALVLKAETERDFAACVRQAIQAGSQATGKNSGLAPWIAARGIGCARSLTPSKENSSLIARSLAAAESHSEWLSAPPMANKLRSVMIAAIVNSLQQDVKSDRTRAEKSITRGEPLLGAAEPKVRAQFWRWAGELAFFRQQTEAAREFYRRSLQEIEDDEVKAKLAEVELALRSSGDLPESEVEPAKVATARAKSTDGSVDENELVDRVTTAMKSGDLVAAVTDATTLIRRYPGGTRAKWATDRVFDCWQSIDDKQSNSVRAELLRTKLMSLMLSADGDTMGEWARSLSGRGAWADSLKLASGAIEVVKGARATAILDLAAKDAIALDDFSTAKKYFEQIVATSSGQPVAREALFRLGLLNFRRGEFVQAESHFESLLVNPQIGQWEILTRYWLWRSLQRLNSPEAESVARDLISKAPFSYYGLRARIELAGGSLDWKNEKRVFKSRLWLTHEEMAAYQRAKFLIEAGWIEEAGVELAILPVARTAEDKAVRAVLLSAAGQFQNAAKLANEAWDEVPELRRSPLVEAAFPILLNAKIKAQARLRKLEPELVRSLIKQESCFNTRAVSSSGALGLMQMIPPTAREIAADLHLGELALPTDMYDPERNIQMGTYYLARVLTRFNGHVPLALAAYNVGSAKIDRWLKNRPSLQNLSSGRSSAPEDEIWIDELPYWETSTYVKAILRNLILYRLLDLGRVRAENPLWLSSESASSTPNVSSTPAAH